MITAGQMQDLQLELMQLYKELQQALVQGDNAQQQVRPMLSLLKDTVQLLARWINTPDQHKSCDVVCRINCASVSIADLYQSSILLMERVTSLLGQIYAIIKSQKYDEQICRAHLSTGVKHLEASEVHSRSMFSLCETIKESFNSFLAPLKQSNGLSMERMWSALRPRTVESYERLQSIWRFEEIVEAFDRKIQSLQAPLTQKVAFRHSFSRAYQLAFNNQAIIDSLILVG